MLPLQFLRVRITNKGKNITPLFCGSEDERSKGLQLAGQMIEEFQEVSRKKERKGLLLERIALLESHYDDYKMFRGLFTLLERRCIFSVDGRAIKQIDNTGSTNLSNDALSSTIIDPIYLRKELFEQSSRYGFALTDLKRKEILNLVFSKIGVSPNDIEHGIWSDLEVNKILESFDTISAGELLDWYNLSLMQTLLFNCTKLEFQILGGLNWKHVLRKVKMLGLMYNLQHLQIPIKHQISEGDKLITGREPFGDSTLSTDRILCSVDGPLSLFKLTDKYGTSVAKLLPTIVSTKKWLIKAWILRKTISEGKKIYDFEISSAEAPPLAAEPALGRAHQLQKRSVDKPSHSSDYDSNVEERFAARFRQFGSGWKLIREPDPFIVSNGKALIPDFAFEKYNRKVYLEIIGFWTKEYLSRKIEKLTAFVTSSIQANKKIDLLIAISDAGYAASNSNQSERLAWKNISSGIFYKRIIVYKKDEIPIKPVIEYLKSIDAEMIEKFAAVNYTKLSKDLENIMDNNNNRIISAYDIAKNFNIPTESVLKVIDSEYRKKKDGSTKYVIIDKYLVPESKVDELEQLLKDVIKFSDACSILEENGIPEPCYGDLLYKLGFVIIWKGIDYNTATIQKHNSSATSTENM